MNKETDSKPLKLNQLNVTIGSALIGVATEFSLNIADITDSIRNKEAIAMIAKETALGGLISGLTGFIIASVYNTYVDKQTSFAEKYKKNSKENTMHIS
jgi:hypothetical protein